MVMLQCDTFQLTYKVHLYRSRGPDDRIDLVSALERMHTKLERKEITFQYGAR